MNNEYNTTYPVWFAVLRDNWDNDWGYGSYDLDKAVEMALKMREDGDENAYIAVNPVDAFCIDEIHDFEE